MANEKVYVLDDGENQREGMTKEQILAAIAEAISTGQVTGDYSAFIEKIKEQNKGAGIKMWVGTQAELLALPEIDADTIYYVSDLSTLADIDNALAELKEQLTDGSFKVGKAGAADTADNVTGQIAGKAISAIFESNGTTAKEATHAAEADNADNADNVTGQIAGKAISAIFESDGTTAKEATHAAEADTADTANNVTGQINGKAITSIFESDGTTAKKATEAEDAKDYLAGGTIDEKFDEIDQRLDNLGFKQGSISGGFIENAPSATLTKQAKYAILKVPQVRWYETTATMSFTAKEKVEVPVMCGWETSPIAMTLMQKIIIEGNTIKLNNTQSTLPDLVQAVQIGFEIV